MIASLEGKIIFFGEKHIVLNVGGIGLKVYVAKNAFDILAEKEGNIKIYTHLHIRENAMDLYGFLSNEELGIFELLIGVSGVGPKMAMTILSDIKINTLKKAVLQGDYGVLLVPGVGKKTAQKIIIDMQNKMDKTGLDDVDVRFFRMNEDVVDALISLGYKKREAEDATRQIPEDVISTQDKVKFALTLLGKKR